MCKIFYSQQQKKMLKCPRHYTAFLQAERHVFKHAAAANQMFEEKQLDLIEIEVLQTQTHLHQKCERVEKPQESLKVIDSILKKKN